MPLKQLKQIIQIKHNIVKNPNWPEADQLAIYKCGRGFELGRSVKQIQLVARAGLEPGTAGLRVRRADHSATLPPDEDKPPLHVFFDIEATQDTNCHVPNLLIAETEHDDCPEHFRGEHCIKSFLEWLDTLTENDTRPVTVIAHNFQGYDGYFIVDEYHRQHRLIEQVRNGGKLMQVTHDRIRFIDSLSFFQMPLSAFPKTFGITELKKGYFPHLFNPPENQEYVGLIPDMKYYMPETMSVSGRKAFETWHAEQVSKQVEFDFDEELVAYCESDVKLLKAGCLKFKQLFEEKSKYLRILTVERNVLNTLQLKCGDKDFDPLESKSKNFYAYLIKEKAKHSRGFVKLMSAFNLSEEETRKAFVLAKSVAVETFVQCFQFKILNDILFLNTRLAKIGRIQSDLCSFCQTSPETLEHFFYRCSFSTEFWNKFENFWLTVAGKQIKLDYINIILGILDQRSNLLNYFIVLGKLYLWNCRKNKQVPLFLPFEDVVKRKYEIEKLNYSLSKHLKLKIFSGKMEPCFE